jgi:outer membrane protein OmpA-like peptidoglycan-associated protein
MFQFASVDIVHATTTVEMLSARDAALMPSAVSPVPALADEATTNFSYETREDMVEVADDDSAPPATGGQATTDFYGDSASPQNPAWAAPAKMNPDYATDGSAAPAATDTGEQAAPSEAGTSSEAAPAQAEESAPPPTGGQATTDYYGDSANPENPAWAAPAKMNPDYTSEPAAPTEQAQPAATEAPAQAAEEPPPPPTGGQATTSYYGDSQTPSNPAWAAPAAMNPDYNASAPAAAAPAAAACRDAVESAAKAAVLHFTEDSAAVAQDSRARLTALANALKDCGGVVVEVHGFTDSVGSSGGNKVLSELRAKKIVDFLTDAGVDASKLKAVGDGEDNPVGDNATMEGRRLNRRVEFVVSGQ